MSNAATSSKASTTRQLTAEAHESSLKDEFHHWIHWLAVVMDDDEHSSKVDLQYERSLYTASVESVYALASEALDASAQVTPKGKARTSVPHGSRGVEVLHLSFYVKRVGFKFSL